MFINRLFILFVLCIGHIQAENLSTKIFGIGLSRTGTKSLTAALTDLGYTILHFPRDKKTYEDLRNAHYDLRVLKECDGVTDITLIPYFIQLHKTYPNAKFILTIREKNAWLQSCRKNWQKKKNSEFTLFMRASVYSCFHFNEERFSFVYDEHVKRVYEYFEDYPDSLLVLPICDGAGWEPLCEFLGRPVPGKPFPSVRR